MILAWVSTVATSFPPFYNPEALDYTLGFFEEVVQSVPCFELRFFQDEKVISLIQSAT